MSFIRSRRSQQSLAIQSIEFLEPRWLMSTTTLRIAAYNVAADINGITAPLPGMATVLAAIGAHSVAGTAKPLDVLALEETTSNADTVQPIVDDLNSIYGAGTYAASPLQLSESGGDAADGNGPSALIYNTHTITLLQSYAVPGTLSSTTGVYRQIGRYELQPIGGAAASDFYMYVDHYKSGTGSTNAAARGKEAAVVRADEATLPSTAHVLYVGDFNTNTDGEAIFENLMATGQGQAFDEFDSTGGIGNVSQAMDALTDASTSLKYRDDYEMATQNVLTDASGLQLVSGSEEAFGNNGSVAEGDSVDSSSNTALADLPNQSAVLQALTTASDHVPIVADYTDVVGTPGPTGGTVSGTVTGGKAGETVYLDVNNNSALDSGELSTTTSSTGTYGFSNVPIGAYVVRQVLPSGYTQTSPTMNYGDHVTVTNGSTSTGNNFTDKAPATGGSVSGTITGGQAGETIYLDANNNSMLDSGELSTTTSSTGTFSFSSVPAGAYVVRQVLPSGTTQTSPTMNYGDHVTVTNGSTSTGNNFTDTAPAMGGSVSGTITGGQAGETIYLDANNNSVLDSGELSTTTSSTGTFTFSSVPIGAYVVRQVLPSGTTQTSPTMNYGDHVTVTNGSSSTGNNFTDTTAHVQLTGTTIGTAGSYDNSGNTIAKATDGNLGTFFDGQASNGNYVGLDIGSSKTITQIAYAPRSGYASRMVGGEFQISTTADFSSGVTTIYTINATPASGLTTLTLSSPVTARYIRYLSPNSSHGDIAEFEVFG